ncbi:MAG TPA: tyrosine-type recombinase/integrase [Chitinophagaceae bacterium]|jgi:integrase/recombinase XerC|nr:tyrosine-type recombinase/integrase [Chitinophagaceae bacterium]
MQAHPVIQPFIDFLRFEKRYSKHTVVAYETDLVAFFDYLQTTYGDVPLADISHVFIRSWLAGLRDEGMTARSINRKISSLRSFFKYGIKTGAVLKSPMVRVTAPKNEKRLPQFVAEGDMKTLLQHVEFGTDWNGRTERLIILLFYHTGMRLAEVIGLKESSLQAGSRTLRVLGKGNKERVLPLGADLVEELTAYGEEKKRSLPEAEDWLLVTEKGKALASRSVYTIVRRYLSLVTTIEKRSPHVLRHSFATHLANNGADLNAVKELLGHSSLAATQVYTHNTIEKLKNIYKKAHPKA